MKTLLQIIGRIAFLVVLVPIYLIDDILAIINFILFGVFRKRRPWFKDTDLETEEEEEEQDPPDEKP